MTVQFQSTLFNSTWKAHLACAGEWLSAGGTNGEDAILEALAESTDTELAVECDQGWGMSVQYEDDDPYGRENWFDIEELTKAFAQIREDPAAYFEWRNDD